MLLVLQYQIIMLFLKDITFYGMFIILLKIVLIKHIRSFRINSIMFHVFGHNLFPSSFMEACRTWEYIYSVNTGFNNNLESL